jgi:hypothetical protein
MMGAKGIPLNDILNSSLVQEPISVKGMDGLRHFANEQAAQVMKGREKPSVMHITHKDGNTVIDITTSNVTEMKAALLVIGYTKKGLLNQIKDWLV